MNNVNAIFADWTASISDLKANPMGVIKQTEGDPIAILNRNEPVFYCVPANTWELLNERLENIQLADLVRERSDGEFIEVNIDDL